MDKRTTEGARFFENNDEVEGRAVVRKAGTQKGVTSTIKIPTLIDYELKSNPGPSEEGEDAGGEGAGLVNGFAAC